MFSNIIALYFFVFICFIFIQEGKYFSYLILIITTQTLRVCHSFQYKMLGVSV